MVYAFRQTNSPSVIKRENNIYSWHFWKPKTVAQSGNRCKTQRQNPFWKAKRKAVISSSYHFDLCRSQIFPISSFDMEASTLPLDAGSAATTAGSKILSTCVVPKNGSFRTFSLASNDNFLQVE
ncbi:hypothetical protein L596_028700 [Steinernema carpocapsae]|uniref:Uncharacterized protein n=1 Tax=Steinernema carpocapsae TaxID=34508 RepID=A0A4U5LZ64_STECR|nr:hypothetical protein L596_028700 [Steinernema carpocapsae]